jgi:hypothetical protein
MSSDRLSELRRQRAQVADHLAWLDREIAACAGAALPPVATPRSDSAPSPSTAPVPADTASEEILHQYHEEAASSPAAARTGCLVFCVAASAAIALVLFAIYWFGYR